MKMVRKSRFILAVLFCSTICVAAQLNDRKASDGSDTALSSATVAGRVFLDDTKAPCRKATVYLQPTASLDADPPPDRSRSQDKGLVTATVETRFDGSYSFAHVPAGSYYVMATCAGYISPFVALSRAEGRSPFREPEPLDPEQRAAKDRILKSLTRIEVQSNLPVSADIVLERGGAISGNVTYDDGGPAAGLEVVPLARSVRDGKETWERFDLQPNPFVPRVVTDDRGNFRISGLPSGKYAVEVDLEFSDSKRFISTSGSSGSSSNGHAAKLAIYSGHTPRLKDAAGFTVRTPEEHGGEDIVIPISKLHTIRGNIVSAHDGHVVNSGQVILFNADDHTYAGSDHVTEENTGFTLSFIFEGDYVLNVPMSADVDYLPVARASGAVGPPQFDAHVLHFYGNSSAPLHVDGDIDGAIINVQEPTAKEAQFYKDAMRQEEQKKQAAEPQ
jgi:hypothetical protein